MTRDLKNLPISAWGRHELEREVERFREYARTVEADRDMYDQLVNTPDTEVCLTLIATFRASIEEAAETREAEATHRLATRITELEKTGGACDVCKGVGRERYALGACDDCYGTGCRVKQVEHLREMVGKIGKAAQEAVQKADAHRVQRDEIQAKLDKVLGLPKSKR